MHVSYVHAIPGILHETTRQLGFRLTGNFRACGGCSMSKEKRRPLRKTTLSRSERPLQRVSVDLAGPKPTQSAGGARYIMLIKDDFSRFGWTYFMKQKSDAGATFKRFLTDIRDSTKPLSSAPDLTAVANSVVERLENCARIAASGKNSSRRTRPS